MTDQVAALMNGMPLARHLSIEVTLADPGYAEGRLELKEHHYSVPGSVAHGAVPYALADTVAGAAVIALTHAPTPTVDMRMDYLAPTTDDLHATADVVREGSSLAVVSVDVTDTDGEPVANAQGVYKTDGADGDSPWERGDRPVDPFYGGSE
jgi:uncharacterized protein (TIGR00369 family)